MKQFARQYVSAWRLKQKMTPYMIHKYSWYHILTMESQQLSRSQHSLGDNSLLVEVCVACTVYIPGKPALGSCCLYYAEAAYSTPYLKNNIDVLTQPAWMSVQKLTENHEFCSSVASFTIHIQCQIWLKCEINKYFDQPTKVGLWPTSCCSSRNDKRVEN